MESGILNINGSYYKTLIAISADEQLTGLMYKDPPLPTMSFIYSYPRVNKFWMKNTKDYLDILFCCNNRISQICVGKPFSTELIGDDSDSDLVVEFQHGFVNSNNVKLGQYIYFLKPTNAELKKLLVKY